MIFMDKSVTTSERIIVGWGPKRNKDGEVNTFFLHYKDWGVVFANQNDLTKKITELIDRIDKEKGRI